MRCLVIEDDPETSAYICNALRVHGIACTASTDGIDALFHALTAQWDLMIVDRMLPGGIDGLDIISKLRRDGIHVPVIVLSALAQIDDRVRGLRSGADDYLSKPFALPELLARIEALLRRARSEYDVGALCLADLQFDTRTMRVSRAGKPVLLQPREYRLLEYLMRHANQVVTRSMVLQAVWDYRFDPQTNVIDVQISRLRAKVDKNFGVPLIHTVRGVGFILAERTVDSDA